MTARRSALLWQSLHHPSICSSSWCRAPCLVSPLSYIVFCTTAFILLAYLRPTSRTVIVHRRLHTPEYLGRTTTGPKLPLSRLNSTSERRVAGAPKPHMSFLRCLFITWRHLFIILAWYFFSSTQNSFAVPWRRKSRNDKWNILIGISFLDGTLITE